MRRSQAAPEFTPRLIRESDESFSVVLSDKAIVRSQISHDKRSTRHYASDDSVVRIDCVDDTPKRTTPYKPSEMFTSINGAAEILGVHPATMRRMATRGDLKTMRIGKQWITSVEWIEEFRKKRRPAGRPRKTA